MSAKKQKRIYMDHAAATPLDPHARSAMELYYSDEFGNPGGLYREGRRAKDALDSARKKVADILCARPEEIVFTSGGTEGDVLALMGVARAYKDKGNHIITTAIEHHAVLETCEALEKEGFEVTYVDVEPNGVVDPEKIKKELRPKTILVSVMYANNEIGTIQPVREISDVMRNFRNTKHAIRNTKDILNLELRASDLAATPLLHTDACQASEYLDLDVQKLGVDLMTINGSKVYGPKGVGALFVRNGVRLKPIFYGGAQEGKRRAGTENVPGIVGFAKALEIATSQRKLESKRVLELRDYFIGRLTKEIPRTILNGDPVRRLPNNVNISILDIEGEATILYLDNEGIACSTGSACTSESLDPSHVILALGKPYEHAHASIRFTLGRQTSKPDVDYVMKKLPPIVETLRRISPITVDEHATSMSHPEAFAGERLRVKARSKNYK